MAVKVGFSLWHIEPPEGLPENTMILGVDVYHCGERTGKSWLGLVGSTDRFFSKYNCQAVEQHTGEEICNCLKEPIKDLINAYRAQNDDRLPQYIVYYRDSVGESRYHEIVSAEINAILATIEENFPDYTPRITAVIINKNIKNKFHSGGNNPPCGTLVNQNVTMPDYFNFFLNSHTARFGTIRPTHYDVIYDTSLLGAEIIEKLTFHLCFGFFNVTSPCKIPTPIKLAHRLAFLTGKSIGSQPSTKIMDKQFYL